MEMFSWRRDESDQVRFVAAYVAKVFARLNLAERLQTRLALFLKGRRNVHSIG